MRTLVCGHSFVRRYRRRYLEPARSHHRDSSRQPDFVESFGLAPNNHVFVSGVGGLMTTFQGEIYLQQQVHATSPDLLLLELGSNDLAAGTDPYELARQVTSLCRKLCDRTSVGVIVLFLVVERRRSWNTDPESFDVNRRIFNRLMKLASRQDNRLLVTRHDRSILVNLRPGRISADDIHVTSPLGLRLYHFSVRRAMTKGQQRFRQIYG